MKLVCYRFIDFASACELVSSPDVYSKNSVMEEDATYTNDLLTGSIPGGQRVLGVSWNPIAK